MIETTHPLSDYTITEHSLESGLARFGVQPKTYHFQSFRGRYATECRVCGRRRDLGYQVGMIPRLCVDCATWAERCGIDATWTCDRFGEKVRGQIVATVTASGLPAAARPK